MHTALLAAASTTSLLASPLAEGAEGAEAPTPEAPTPEARFRFPSFRSACLFFFFPA